MNYWLLALLILISYLIGNINFGKILSKRKNVDITKTGSGNSGATNMFRTFGAKLGYLTLILDALKGIIAALLGLLLIGGTPIECRIAMFACGLSAVVGHIFPIVYKFKGGKGIATCLGVFLVAQPIVTLITFVFLFIYVWFFKYVSVASLLLTTVILVYENLTMPEPNLTISLITFTIWCLTWFAHRANIGRLLFGRENPTNIQAKIFRDKKTQQKREEKLDQRAEKIEIKYEKREEKAELKLEKKLTKSNSRNNKNKKYKSRKKIKKTKSKQTKSTKHK